MIESLFVHTATITRPTRAIASKEYSYTNVAIGTVQCFIQPEGESLVDTPNGPAVEKTFSAFFAPGEDIAPGDLVDWVETGDELVVRTISKPFASFGAQTDHIEALLAARKQS